MRNNIISCKDFLKKKLILAPIHLDTNRLNLAPEAVLVKIHVFKPVQYSKINT